MTTTMSRGCWRRLAVGYAGGHRCSCCAGTLITHRLCLPALCCLLSPVPAPAPGPGPGPSTPTEPGGVFLFCQRCLAFSFVVVLALQFDFVCCAAFLRCSPCRSVSIVHVVPLCCSFTCPLSPPAFLLFFSRTFRPINTGQKENAAT